MSQDYDTFRREVVRVMGSGPPSSGDDLLGMEIDFDAYLGGLDELEESSLTVRRTENAETLLLAEATAARGVSLGQAARAVRETWLDSLRYQFHEAHHLVLASSEAVLRFITQIGPSEFYVTGRVEIHAERR